MLRKFLDSVHPYFEKSGKKSLLYPFFEALDTFLYTPGETAQGRTHMRDALDLKRMMITVVFALTPCILMAMYNTGLQIHLALVESNLLAEASGCRVAIMSFLGLALDPHNPISNFVHGSLYFIPVFLVCNIAGGLIEALFAVVRKHEINEGFLVTGMLFPLTLPPTIPLWQVAVAIIFAVLIAKEVYGGTGKNFLNIALTARAFLYFAYPAEITGDAIWVAVDGFTHATPLGIAAADGMAAVEASVTWQSAFLGFLPGSMGEGSTLFCLVGAFILVLSGIGSLRIMVGTLLGALALSTLLYTIGSPTNPMWQIPPHWHLVLGGFAFGLVFMATDPVSAAMTNTGKWIYGFLIGFMTILIRSLNPAFPEGIMLAILFGNVFAPLIDYFVIKAGIKRRQARLLVPIK